MLENLSETVQEAVQKAIMNSFVSLGKWLLEGIVASSYWVCLLTGMFAMILYIGGNKKAGRYVTTSIVVYIIIRAIGGVLL